jgi:hypothetical protein
VSVQVKNRTASYGAFLEQVSGAEKGRVFELHATRLTVGRANDCDIQVDIEGVSRVHALLVRSDGSWFIRDNNSKNGIYVNGKQLKESWLENGDVVQLGTFLFKFGLTDIADGPAEGNLPVNVEMGSDIPGMELGLSSGVGMATSKKKGNGSLLAKLAGNRRAMIYLGVVVLLGGVLMMSGGETPKTDEGPASAVGADGQLARDFKTAGSDKDTTIPIGTKPGVPSGMEDPLLKKAEKDMAKLDWSNTSLREAEQFFRRGQREYLNHNYHRAIDSFQTALSLYGGHLLAERYLRRSVYEVEIEAKLNMAIGIQYYESLQYSRAIHHFNEVIAMMSHRPDEAIIKEAKAYIKQAELRLQAAELFP